MSANRTSEKWLEELSRRPASSARSARPPQERAEKAPVRFEQLVALRWQESAEGRQRLAELGGEIAFRARLRSRRIVRRLRLLRPPPTRALLVVLVCATVTSAALGVAGIWVGLGLRLGGIGAVTPTGVGELGVMVGAVAGGVVAGIGERAQARRQRRDPDRR